MCYGFAQTHLRPSLVSSLAQSCLRPLQLQVAEIVEALGSWFNLTISCDSALGWFCSAGLWL